MGYIFYTSQVNRTIFLILGFYLFEKMSWAFIYLRKCPGLLFIWEIALGFYLFEKMPNNYWTFFQKNNAKNKYSEIMPCDYENMKNIAVSQKYYFYWRVMYVLLFVRKLLIMKYKVLVMELKSSSCFITIIEAVEMWLNSFYKVVQIFTWKECVISLTLFH